MGTRVFPYNPESNDEDIKAFHLLIKFKNGVRVGMASVATKYSTSGKVSKQDSDHERYS